MEDRDCVSSHICLSAPSTTAEDAWLTFVEWGMNDSRPMESESLQGSMKVHWDSRSEDELESGHGGWTQKKAMHKIS
jgi:hypothetical protein